jgi:hypothetical protein
VAAFLVDRRLQSWKRLAALRGADGTPILKPDTLHEFSISDWSAVLESREWDAPIQVYLTNGPLVDTAVGPELLGQLDGTLVVNSIAPVESRCSLMSTFAISSPDLRAGNPRFAEMSPEDQDNAFVYVLAQAIGVRVLLQKGAELSEGAGLARPIYSLPDLHSLADDDSWRLPDLNSSPSLLHYTQLMKIIVRMEIFAAKRDRHAIHNEFLKSTTLDLPYNYLLIALRTAQRLEIGLPPTTKPAG